VLGRDVVDSFGVKRKEVEDERGCTLGRNAWGAGGGRDDLRAGEYGRLLKGGGVPEGVE
jgi:hypothetical protein